jgi:uncharacterized protein
MFLACTLLNVVAVLVGATLGVLVGARMPRRMQESLTDGLGLFPIALGASLTLGFMLDGGVPIGHQLAVMAALLAGIVIGELLRLSDRLDALGAYAQRRLAGDDQTSRFSEGFVTSSIVFVVGPLTILGSVLNGLANDVQLLTVKSLLDGVASIAFAAALGAGVYLSAATVLVVQGSIATGAFLLGAGLADAHVAAISAVGGLLLIGVGLRLLDIRQVRVVNFLPALLLAPVFVWLADQLARLLPG